MYKTDDRPAIPDDRGLGLGTLQSPWIAVAKRIILILSFENTTSPTHPLRLHPVLTFYDSWILIHAPLTNFSS